MTGFPSLFGVAIGMVALLGDLAAAESIVDGKIKSIELEKREFVLTDEMKKDRTVIFDEDTIINRGGRDGQSELKVDDSISIYYENRGLVWRANYVLVREKESKDLSLGQGDVKSSDADKKKITYTDEKGRSWSFSTANVPVYINRTQSELEKVKVGEHIMVLQQKVGDQTTLKGLYVTRK